MADDRDAPDPTPVQLRSALLAAECAGEAVVELLRFHREGSDGFSPFGDPEPVAKLAEALLRAARIEGALFPPSDKLNAEYVSAVGQLAAACDKFLQDQCSLTIMDFEVPA